MCGRRRRTRWGLVGLVLAPTLAAACSSGSPSKGPRAGAFSFGMWGDTPYTNGQAQALPRLVDEMNGAKLAFVVNIGDIQGGGRCDNGLYSGFVDTFGTFEAPLVYTPGDNEWTDCHTTGQDPVERLDHIRRVMFPTSTSFGKRMLRLAQQRPGYPENGRWRMGDVVFVTINVSGSNNNHISDPDADEQATARGPAERRAAEAEYRARDQADRDWLHQSFQEATRGGAAAVVVFMQADPGFSVPAADRVARQVDGYDRLLTAFLEETKAFAKPVLVGHGDSHRLTFDQPFLDPDTGQPVPNFYRAESFGSPDVGWVRITVDVTQSKPFRMEDHFIFSG